MSDQNFRLVMHNWIPVLWSLNLWINIIGCVGVVLWTFYMMGQTQEVSRGPWGGSETVAMMPAVVGWLTILGTVVGTFVWLVFVRFCMEFYIAVIRIADDTRIARKIAEK